MKSPIGMKGINVNDQNKFQIIEGYSLKYSQTIRKTGFTFLNPINDDKDQDFIAQNSERDRISVPCSNILNSPDDNSFFKKKENGISLIIPTKNEEKNIPHVFPFIPSIVDEIVVVDSSSDDTIKVIKEYSPDAKIIKTEPKGKGNALKIGFQNASHDIIVMMDADGSMNPQEISQFTEPLKNGMDVVQGSRILGGSEDLTHIRRFGNFFFVSLVNSLYGSRYTDMCYGFRSFRKKVIESIVFSSDGFDVETELSILAHKKGFRICEIPSYESNRIHGVSNLCAVRDGFKILSRIIAERGNSS